MKILLNLIPIKSGGGQQVAANFLKQISYNSFNDIEFVILATDGTYIAKILKNQKSIQYYLTRSGIINRFLFQRYTVREIYFTNNCELIYTLFGPPILIKGVISVCGNAYSNIFFPEIKFWRGNIFFRLRKKLIDKYRLNISLRADAIIFENIAMKERAKDLFSYTNSCFIPPSVSYNESNPSGKYLNQRKLINDCKFNILMLTGWHQNKNLELIPDILLSLKDSGESNISIVVSLDIDKSYSKKILERCKEYGVENNLVFIGPVESSDVKFLSKSIDCFMLISLLESFSNNIIEAWSYSKVLIISDAIWSRKICNSACVYVNRNDPSHIALELTKLKNDDKQYQKIVELGKKELMNYPSPYEKVELQLNYLKKLNEEKT
jgi:glycosyltransferase involved in cell wall biosynthesis